MLVELDNYVAPGSRADGRRRRPGDRRAGRRGRPAAAAPDSSSYRAADTTDRAVLESLDGRRLRPHHRALLLGRCSTSRGRRAHADHAAAPARHRAKRGESFTIVSEMLDIRNRELAEVTRADDFIVSDKLVSLIMTQIAENPAPRRRLRRPVRRGGLRDLPQAGRRLRRARASRSTSTPSSRRRGAAARSRSATGCWPWPRIRRATTASEMNPTRPRDHVRRGGQDRRAAGANPRPKVGRMSVVELVDRPTDRAFQHAYNLSGNV